MQPVYYAYCMLVAGTLYDCTGMDCAILSSYSSKLRIICKYRNRRSKAHVQYSTVQRNIYVSFATMAFMTEHKHLGAKYVWILALSGVGE